MQKTIAFLDLIAASPATIYNNPGLGTTLVKFGDASSASPGVAVRLLQLTNKSTSQYVAFMPSSAASPTAFVASAGGIIAATEGINVGPGSSYFLNLKSSVSLWIVASAASTAVQIVAYDKPVR